jgi:hypothetical protein
VFLCLIAKMSEQFLEQCMNIKFYVKFRKSTSDTYAMFSKSYGGGAMKKWRVEWHKQFAGIMRMWKMIKEIKTVLIISLISRVFFTFNSFHKTKQLTKLIIWKYWSSAWKKAWTLTQWLDSAPWQCSSSQSALPQAVCSPNIYYQNGHSKNVTTLKAIPQ